VHELIGCRLVDVSGVDHGEVVAVQDNPAADLLVLADGRLVPMTFVTDVVAGERVVVDPPAGLLDGDL
jgi:ribosomal 30S subunit maturation factor RimM